MAQQPSQQQPGSGGEPDRSLVAEIPTEILPAPTASFRRRAWNAFQRALDPLAPPRPPRLPRRH